MTTRQWRLYTFLVDNYSEDRYISKKEIVDALPEYYEIKQGETRTCRDIEFDVRDINADTTIQKIIVSNSKGYKIGNPQQVADYVLGNIEACINNIKHYYRLKRKAQMNNQVRLKFGQERDYIETYIMEGRKKWFQ